MEAMLAFLNDPAVKDIYLSRVRAHQEADELIHGKYWENGKGCAVGCTIHGSQHAKYETLLGIPRVLAHLEDSLFESLPNGEAKVWPSRFLEAIPVGADLSRVLPKFLRWLLVDDADGVVKYAKRKQTVKAIRGVALLLDRVCDGQTVTLDEWRTARATATAAYAAADVATYAAAADAAYAAATATDAYAAAAAADAAAYAAYADYAADAYAAAADAAYAADYAAARYQSRVRQSEKLLELLTAAPVMVAA